MSDPFVGEIRAFPFGYVPAGWAACAGQILPIAQYQALFSLLGTNFGGNGTSNFGLPALQGRVPVDWGQGPGLTARDLGESGGEATVTLTTAQVPSHTHALQASARPADLKTPGPQASLARSNPVSIYTSATTPPPPLEPLATGALGSGVGGNQPHNNLMPYLTLNFCIALQGIFPPRG